jgi:1-acylglycerone phosphate reductase
MISETLRLELAPFQVKVITCITGVIETNLMVNSWKQELPADSIYKPASKEISDRASGRDVPDTSTPEEFAQKLVRDVTSGVTGKVYRGKLASMSNILSTHIPTGTLVSCTSVVPSGKPKLILAGRSD